MESERVRERGFETVRKREKVLESEFERDRDRERERDRVGE